MKMYRSVLLVLGSLLFLIPVSKGYTEADCGHKGEQTQGFWSGYALFDAYWVAQNHDTTIEGRTGFWFRRIYQTYDRPLTDNVRIRFRMEFNSPGDFETSSGLSMKVKDAYVAWSPLAGHTLVLGLSPTPTWSNIEKIWGYRAVEKAAPDLFKFGASRNLGVSLKGSLRFGIPARYWVMVSNGEGGKAEVNRGKMVLASLSFTPLPGWIVEVYGDYADLLDARRLTTAQVFFAYQGDRFHFGAHWTQQSREPDGQTLRIFSGFITQALTPTLAGYLRYDRMMDPNPSAEDIAYSPFSSAVPFHLIIAGVAWKVNERFSILPHVEYALYDTPSEGNTIGPDLYARVTFYTKW